MIPTTDEMEANVLAILEADQDAWYSAFNPHIMEACGGSFIAARGVCKHLRQLKKVDARGRGEMAQYAYRRSP